MSARLLSPANVAVALGVRPQTLRAMRMRGGGPPFVRLTDSPTGRAFYPAEEFEAWLAARPRHMSTAGEKRAASFARPEDTGVAILADP